MSWLRIDDGFTANGKIGQLTDSEFRCWIRLLCHCAKSKDPTVDAATIREVSGLTAARVARYASLELLDVVGDSFEVHDWEKYLPRDNATERQARWRSRKTLALVPDEASTSVSTGASTSESTGGSTRVRARADTRPVPSRNSKSLRAPAAPSRPPDLLWEALCQAMGHAPETAMERKRWNTGLRDIRQAGGTPEQILARAAAYRREWPTIELTPTGLASNWSRFNGMGQASPTELRLAELSLKEAA